MKQHSRLFITPVMRSSCRYTAFSILSWVQSEQPWQQITGLFLLPPLKRGALVSAIMHLITGVRARGWMRWCFSEHLWLSDWVCAMTALSRSLLKELLISIITDSKRKSHISISPPSVLMPKCFSSWKVHAGFGLLRRWICWEIRLLFPCGFCWWGLRFCRLRYLLFAQPCCLC